MRTTRVVAAELSVTEAALFSMMRRGVVRPPPRLPGSSVYLWSDSHVEAARAALAARRRRSPAAPSA